MVAIVTGAGLGLDRSSAKVFAAVGQQGGQLGDATFGRYGENVFVNAADGNLMIDRTDEVLIGRGPDDIITRSYNSQSTNQGYQTHNGWQINDQRAIVGLGGGTGVNTNGSYVTRIDADGSDTVYTYVNNSSDPAYGTYVSRTAGNGEYRLTYSSGTWTWNDAKNNLTETYDATNGGRLSGTSDNDGNSLSYAYDSSGRLSTITTANGEYTQLFWMGTSQNLAKVVTHRADGSTVTRVRYSYDAYNRLSTVTTDLTPDDNSVSDGAKVVTTYAYVGTSDRVNKITQTGGAELDITYDTSNRVHTLSQVIAGTTTRATTFTYNSSTSTTITDNNGQATDLTFDTNGQLLSVTYPAASTGATRETYSYTYNSDGSLKSVTDPLLNVTKYTYDGNDNLATVKDAYANTTSYTYDASNHVLSKTFTPASGSATTIRYAYNSKELLRFTVDGDGEVTQYQYDNTTSTPTYGQLTAVISYKNNTYTASGTISETGLMSWVSGADKSAVLRTDYHYDPRGNLDWQKTYTACDGTTGLGLTSQPYTAVNYVYDQYGSLRTRLTSGMTNTEVFAYDGLGRMISSVDLNGAHTTMAWNDGANTYTVTHTESGLIQVSTYDVAGELVTASQSGPDYTGGTTTYKYDALGQLGMTIDANGVTNYFLYDNLGRKTADIAEDGATTEYRYDNDNNLIATIAYAGVLTPHHLSLLVDGSGNPTNVDINTVCPDSSSGDAWSWRIYDNDGRLTETIDGDGDVTAFVYDGASNLISTTSYYNKLNVATAGTGGTSLMVTLPTANILPSTNAKDDTTRTFYDSEDRVVGTLDDNGYFSRVIYNDAGQKIETIAYSTKVTSGDMGDPFATLITDVGTTSADIHTRYFYDDRGLLLYSLDASLHATQYVYDAAGHLTNTIGYAAPIASAGTYTLAYVQAQAGALPANVNNRVSWAVYDPADGNLLYSIDANGGVTAYTYDAQGNVTRKIEYSTFDHVTSLPDAGTMSTWETTNASPSTDRTTRMVYDAAGELVYTIDAENYVTQNQYNAGGQITSQTRYAETCSLHGVRSQDDMIGWVGSANAANAVQTTYLYDVDGRLSDTILDPAGLAIDTQTKYDAQGRVTDVIVAAGTGDAATTHYTYDTANRILTETRAYGTADAATTSYTLYDGMGNALTVQDPNGNTTTYTYDSLGQMLTQIDALGDKTVYTYDAFGNVLTNKDPTGNTTTYTYNTLGQVLTKTDALGNVTSYTYDAFGNVLTTTDPLGGVVYSFYDGLGQLVLQIDQMRYATATTYSLDGAVTSVERYAATVGGTITPGSLPALTGTLGEDATTTFAVDRLDRVTQVTDADGFYEKYTIDAFGNRTAVWAKSSDGTVHDGGETINVYDKRGLLTSETLPIGTYDNNGNPVASSIQNTYAYDARGNRTQMIEAYQLDEQRTTTYVYNDLDQLVQTKGDDIDVVSDTDINSVTTITPTTTVVYDKNGNVIETTDPAGAPTWFYYDAANRKIAQIDALGALSTWAYDDGGNMVSARIYDNPVSLPVSPGGAPSIPAPPAGYRETTYTYDAINRLLTTTVADLLTGAYASGQYTTQEADVTTYNHYNVGVNSLRQMDGNGVNSWTFYDSLGRKIGEVDKDKYVTVYTLDADGNITQETRYANAISLIIGDTKSLDDVKAAIVADTTNDRVTNFTYDRNGNRLTEQRINVDSYTIDSSGALTEHATATSIITYTYNGLGEVLTKTEAAAAGVTGDSTTYEYDAGGRQIDTVLSVATNVDTTTVQERTNERYDGLGNLTFTSSFDFLSTSRVYEQTHYTYGAGGRLISSVDAAGFGRDYHYDAAGRTVLVSYTRFLADGTSNVKEADVTQYDLLGRAVAQGTATSDTHTGLWVPNDMQETTYTVFGEVASQSINGKTQKTYDYDDGGRMWRSKDEGVVTLYLYDETGNQTLSATSDGGELAGAHTWANIGIEDAVTLMTSSGVIGGSTPVTGLVETITVYDARGQATQTREPVRQLAAGATPVTITSQRSYNAFGEVTSETDGNGNVSSYTYNTMGKVTVETLPAVYYTNDVGVTSSTAVTPILYNYYDIAGRLIGVKDANNNLNTRTLLANTGYDGSDALVTEEFHMDTGTVKTIYDAFGNVKEAINAVGAVTDYTYDKMNRVLTVQHPTSDNGSSRLMDHYAYDGLGQRLTNWNSMLGPTVMSTTDYDAEGRVVQTTDMDGYTTTYGYLWQDSQGSSGHIQDDGGWTKTTTNTAGMTDTVKQDAEGRALYETDFSGNTLDYSYDYAGRLASRGNSYAPDSANGDSGEPFWQASGETLTYTYFNTGLVAQTSSKLTDVEVDYNEGDDGSNPMNIRHNDKLVTNYAYDKNGNQTLEDTFDITSIGAGETDPVTTAIEHETATWDALNRMTGMTDSAYTGSGVTNAVDDPVTIAIKYDLNGNVRERLSTYYLLTDTGAVSTTQSSSDDWYKYDTMNRFTTTKGEWVDANHNGLHDASDYIDRGTGTDIAYDLAGQRKVATTTVSGAANVESYTYSAAGYLTEVDVKIGAGASTKRGSYSNDLMGRVLSEIEYDVDGITPVYKRNSVTYDNDSLTTHDVVYTRRTDGTTITWTTDYSYTADLGHGAVFEGGVVTSETASETGAATAHTLSTFAVQWFSGPQQGTETYDGDTTSGTNTIYYSTMTYDQREDLTDAAIHDGVQRHVVYQYNATGQITKRDTQDVTNAPHARYWYFSGIQMGDVSNDGTSNMDYASSIAQQRKLPGGGFFQGGAGAGVHVADFDQSYQAINNLTYATAPGVYTAQSGDTLQSIAQSVWGDASFWYLIANANGLDNTSTISAGESIIIPDKVANNQNNSSTYNVYDPNEHIGNISPTHPPKPASNHNCGIIGQILEVIVAVVVTIVAGPIMGDAAKQIVALADGDQKSFNWKELGVTAATALLVGPGGGGSLLETVGHALVYNAVYQGLNIAVGNQKSFDWTGLAIAAVSAGVSHEVQVNTPFGSGAGQVDLGGANVNGYATTFASSMAGAVAGAAARTLINGSDFGDNLIKGLPDVIGQTIGGAIADAIMSAGQQSGPAPQQQISLPQQQVNYQVPNVNEDGTVTWSYAQDPLRLGVKAANTIDPIPMGDGPPGPIEYDSNHVEIVTVTALRRGAAEQQEEPSAVESYVQRLKDDVVGAYNNLLSTVDFAGHHPVAFAESVASQGWDTARNTVKWGGNFVHTMWSPGGPQQVFGQAAGTVTNALGAVQTAYNNGTLPAMVATRAADATIVLGTLLTDTEELDVGLAGSSPRLFQSGARQLLNPGTLEGIDAAPAAYDAIRADTMDVSAIARNTGMPEARISQIKDHLFSNDHILDDRVGQFDADPDIANAWSRLTNGDHVDSDIDLLNHEYFESRFESLYNTDARTAHYATIRSGRLWQPGD